MTPKVLLVDDVAMFLELQRTFLRHSSVRVFTAKDGIEALVIAQNERPDLVMMDLHMPNMDGAECCTRIKQDPLLRSVPVVMITTEGKEDDKALCYQAGCDDFMTKPIDRGKYLEKARKYVPGIDRRSPRFPYRTKVKLKIFGLTLTGEIMDISAHGVYVATDYQVEMETALEFAFALQEEAGALIQAKGRVAWINGKNALKKKNFPPGFGIEFLAMTNLSRLTLDYFLEKRLPK
ncbi:MAG TPA: response regulator [Geobacteraceae bacterium]|nr:response regulator [Geobacteraceae bacterium]